MWWTDISRIQSGVRSGMGNGGWCYDAYPDLQPLKAGATIPILEIEGCGVITCIHTTQHLVIATPQTAHLSEAERRALSARGVVLLAYFDGSSEPSVCVPLGDFFADGCGGKAGHFTSLWVEKAPESYNAHLPMPFRRSARVLLRNDTPYDMANYSFVEYQLLPELPQDIGYLHATWRRFAFQLSRDSDELFFRVQAQGHLVGRAWSVCTDEPLYREFHFVMEGNNSVYVDGESQPRYDYLGSEDSFGFSWGFQRTFAGLYAGINYVRHLDPAQLSIYRFHPVNPIRFEREMQWRVNWKHEFRDAQDFHRQVRERRDAGGCWVDYAVTTYWYQREPGYVHEPLPPLEERLREVLKPNPK
ncbi:MAG: DUF2961 domain-containing protein [Chthonomonadetes bacterium]|nr:DUF2961 domain-containing protein [Chthonomonadetes bacterium]